MNVCGACFLIVSLAMALFCCGLRVSHGQSYQLPWIGDASAKLEQELVAKYGEDQRVCVRRGLQQIAAFWRSTRSLDEGHCRPGRQPQGVARDGAEGNCPAHSLGDAADQTFPAGRFGKPKRLLSCAGSSRQPGARRNREEIQKLPRLRRERTVLQRSVGERQPRPGSPAESRRLLPRWQV